MKPKLPLMPTARSAWLLFPAKPLRKALIRVRLSKTIANGSEQVYRTVISTAAHDYFNRSFVIPAQTLRAEHELLNSVKGISAVKLTMEQLLESGTQLHPSTTTGHVVTSETLTFLQAQKKQKVAKAADAETRGQALKERRAELIVSHKADGEKVLAVAQGVNGQTAWKALNKPVLDGAFRSWGGVVSALADSKKPTLLDS